MLAFPFAVGAAAFFSYEARVAGTTATADAPRLLAEPLAELEEPRAFEAEAVLLAVAEEPVDLCADELGALYVLQADGRVLRVAGADRAASGLSASTLYADLGGSGRSGTPSPHALEGGLALDAATGAVVVDPASVAESRRFAALALHPHFLVPDQPGFGKFYAVARERAGAGRPDFSPEFGGGVEHHQDVLYEYRVDHPMAGGRFCGPGREVLRLSQPGGSHNLEGLAFDPQGRLYLGVGDGAAGEVRADGASKNASSLANVYGKVLRIDPLGDNAANGRYGIPDSNPFRLVTEALPELWAFGLRAPHRLHYDPYLRSLCLHETTPLGAGRLHFSPRGAEHFGWDLIEGPRPRLASERARLDEVVSPSWITLPASAVDPQARPGAAPRPSAGSVVYRGERFPSLAGRLLLAASGGRIVAAPAGGEPGAAAEPAVYRLEALRGKEFTAIKSTREGEIVLLCSDGSVYELRKSHSAGPRERDAPPLYCAAPSG